MLRSRLTPHFVGVLGWPLEHTLSPVIHNAAFKRVGLNWVYLAWPVPPEALADAITGMRALGGMGANVTMPHKEGVVELVDELSGDARTIGAVNTIQRFGDRLIGHNTDVDGFREFLVADAGVDPGGSKTLVLGAGGAARAIVRALDDLGAGAITIAARRPDSGRGLLEL
ncbi:MAG: shikimate dehydrogenase family protein, partial [Actinomycetota bacterium]